MEIADRLKAAREARFSSASQASEAFGWKYPTYSSHENGHRGIPLDEIIKYARAFRVRKEWLAFGDGDDPVPGENPMPVESPFVSIPRYAAELSAGGGAISEDVSAELDRIPFTADFLKDRLGRDSIDGLMMVKAAGESMEPTITDGDLVMVDTRDQKHRAGIFAFMRSGESFVKRLEWIDGGVTVISDHPSYPAATLTEEEAFLVDFELIGRVRWVGRTFS